MGSVLHLPHVTHRNLAAGVWRLVDPKIALASIVPFLCAVALAVSQGGSLPWGLAAAAFAAIFLVEVGKNAVNDLCDFESDVAVTRDERSPFSGGKRTLVDMLLTDRDLAIVAWIAFIGAGLIGLQVASRSEPMLLLLGAVAAAISVVYAAPPIKLSSRGLGELAVFLVYGPGIVLGTLMLLRAEITREAVLLSTALGFLIANVLLINEIPDERADRQARKNTLVVRLGRERAETLIDWMFVFAFAIPAIAALYEFAPFRLLGLSAGAPCAVLAMRMLVRTRHQPPVAAQALTLATYVVSGLGYAVAVMM